MAQFIHLVGATTSGSGHVTHFLPCDWRRELFTNTRYRVLLLVLYVLHTSSFSDKTRCHRNRKVVLSVKPGTTRQYLTENVIPVPSCKLKNGHVLFLFMEKTNAYLPEQLKQLRKKRVCRVQCHQLKTLVDRVLSKLRKKRVCRVQCHQLKTLVDRVLSKLRKKRVCRVQCHQLKTLVDRVLSKLRKKRVCRVQCHQLKTLVDRVLSKLRKKRVCRVQCHQLKTLVDRVLSKFNNLALESQMKMFYEICREPLSKNKSDMKKRYVENMKAMRERHLKPDKVKQLNQVITRKQATIEKLRKQIRTQSSNLVKELVETKKELSSIRRKHRRLKQYNNCRMLVPVLMITLANLLTNLN